MFVITLNRFVQLKALCAVAKIACFYRSKWFILSFSLTLLTLQTQISILNKTTFLIILWLIQQLSRQITLLISLTRFLLDMNCISRFLFITFRCYNRSQSISSIRIISLQSIFIRKNSSFLRFLRYFRQFRLSTQLLIFIFIFFFFMI